MKYMITKDSMGQDVAINVSNITQIKILGGDVCILSGDNVAITSFPSVRHAVQYVLAYAADIPKTKELS